MIGIHNRSNRRHLHIALVFSNSESKFLILTSKQMFTNSIQLKLQNSPKELRFAMDPVTVCVFVDIK